MVLDDVSKYFFLNNKIKLIVKYIGYHCKGTHFGNVTGITFFLKKLLFYFSTITVGFQVMESEGKLITNSLSCINIKNEIGKW